MEKYKSLKGIGPYYILGTILLADVFGIFILNYIDSYVLASLIKVLLVGTTIYLLYYFCYLITLRYCVKSDGLLIYGLWGLKKVKIPFKDIKAYYKTSGHIKGVRLSGMGLDYFAIGRSVIDHLGTTYMFVTSSKNIIYIKTDDINYAISPEQSDRIEAILKREKISDQKWEAVRKNHVHLYRDRKFSIPFFLVSIVIVILTLNPFILYLQNKLPSKMPLSFNANFIAVSFGTGKQFAFIQMIYGALNMAILFCMYYAAYFYAKYDRRASYKFIYVSLIIAVVFLFMQVRILINFR